MAVTGLLRCINLSAWHIHNGGQISWSWPWSTGPINHDLMRQKSCHIALAGRSTYQSRHVQGWSDPRWLMSLITLDSTVTQRGKTSRKNEYRLLIFPYKCSGTSVVTSWGKLLSTWRGDISCELVRKLSQDWEDDRINSAGGPKTMIRPQSCQDPEKLCLLFPQTFSMKSIVSRPLECNFSLSLSLSSLWDWDRYCMKWCTLLWLCLTFIAFFFLLFFPLLLHFFFSFSFFSSGSCFVLFPSPIWLHFIIRLTDACHTFADLRPEDDVIEMISCGITTHMAVLHPVPVLSSSTRPCPWEPTFANYKTQAYMFWCPRSRTSSVHEHIVYQNISSCMQTHIHLQQQHISAKQYSRCVIPANALWLWDKWGLEKLIFARIVIFIRSPGFMKL